MLQLYVALLIAALVVVRSLFWARQPVRHWYDAFPVQFTQGNRFCDFTDYRNDPPLDEVEARLQRPPMYASVEVLRPLLSGCAVSTSATNCVATRAVSVRYKGAKMKGRMHEFVADDSAEWRKLFCTHEAACTTPSLFVCSERLFLVAPVASYKLRTLKTLLPKRSSTYRLVQAKKIITLHEILVNNVKSSFQAVSPLQTVWRWVVEGLLRVMVLKDKAAVKGALFFKKTMEVAGNKPVLDLVAGVYPKNDKQARAALTNMIRNSRYVVRVHALGDLAALNLKVLKEEDRHLYFYNHGTPSFEAADCFVL
jgi:hypothetical protein